MDAIARQKFLGATRTLLRLSEILLSLALFPRRWHLCRLMCPFGAKYARSCRRAPVSTRVYFIHWRCTVVLLPNCPSNKPGIFTTFTIKVAQICLQIHLSLTRKTRKAGSVWVSASFRVGDMKLPEFSMGGFTWPINTTRQIYPCPLEYRGR